MVSGEWVIFAFIVLLVLWWALWAPPEERKRVGRWFTFGRDE